MAVPLCAPATCLLIGTCPPLLPRLQAHLRAVLGWPLGDCGLRVGASIMLNILGEVRCWAWCCCFLKFVLYCYYAWEPIAECCLSCFGRCAATAAAWLRAAVCHPPSPQSPGHACEAPPLLHPPICRRTARRASARRMS